MKWSSSIRKWSRLIHRDLSFFFAGMVLIYAISGIVMNHQEALAALKRAGFSTVMEMHQGKWVECDLAK